MFVTNQNIDFVSASFAEFFENFSKIFGNLEICGVEIGLKIFRKGRILKILIIFGDFEIIDFNWPIRTVRNQSESLCHLLFIKQD